MWWALEFSSSWVAVMSAKAFTARTVRWGGEANAGRVEKDHLLQNGPLLLADRFKIDGHKYYLLYFCG